MTPEEQVEALAHGLMDYDAHWNACSPLHRPSIRESALPFYREYAERFLVSRLHEVEIQEAGE